VEEVHPTKDELEEVQPARPVLDGAAVRIQNLGDIFVGKNPGTLEPSDAVPVEVGHPM